MSAPPPVDVTGTPPAPGRHRARRLRAPLALAIVALGVVGVVLATHRGSGGQEPADAVTALFDARRDGSCADYVTTTTAFFRNDAYLGSPTCEDFAAEAAELAGQEPVRVHVESSTQVDVDTTEVEVVETYRAGTADEYTRVMAYRVQLEDGAWKVDHVDLTVLR